MAQKFLFRKDLDKRCIYCDSCTQLNKNEGSCRRVGIVNLGYHCKHFKYNPLKRVPPKQTQVRYNFSEEDFKINN